MPEFTAQQQAEIDQVHAAAMDEHRSNVAEARKLVEQYGPAMAPYFLAEQAIRDTAGPIQVEALAGALGLALVELARREVPDA